MTTSTPLAPTTFDPRAWQLWGKADPKQAEGGGPAWHPLLCHVLDVVACAERLLLDARRDRLVALALALALPAEEALPWLLFFVALHDMGKATPPFQAKVDSRRAELVRIGLDFPVGDEPHGNLSVPLVTAVLARYDVPPPLARWVARAVGAHHGEFVSLSCLSQKLEADRGVLLKKHGGSAALWASLRGHLVAALASVCGIGPTTKRPAVPQDPAARHAFVADLAGLTTVADWLGSNAAVFTYVDPPPSVEEYRERAGKLSTQAVNAAGWRRPPVARGRGFQQLFEKPPWPLHQAVEALTPKLNGPSLVIVEAPMGEGKTEAAFLIFEALAARGATGLYFALPTQATSNQIFGRVDRFLRGAFPGEVHGLHLVHGDAGLTEAYDRLKRDAFALRSVDGVAGKDQGPVADAWFARSKRALLAPLAVGTVDQALMSVLGVRHGFLRLHALAGKVVVIDEVHAYDTYTSALLDRLLAWLRALDATVVLLSATLPSGRRDALVRSFAAEPRRPAPYPRITVASAAGSESEPFAPRGKAMAVSVSWQDPATLPVRLAAALEGGGCAVWIVNTVRRAQETYLRLVALRERGLLPSDVEIDLLHARFPFDTRWARERAAERSFGPGEDNRPRAAILVGTQVLEQSLDLDFDLMVTELAPIDLVLQRAGRLHRHQRATKRPSAVERPALWLVRPEDTEAAEGPTFGSSAYIYAESVLLRTWLLLRDRLEINLPTDIEPLVEAVYRSQGPVPAEMADRLAALDREREEEARRESDQARQVVLSPPEARDPFGDLSWRYDDENPAIHKSLRAVTRLGDPTVEVVPVVERGGRTVLAGAPSVTIDLNATEPPPYPVVVATARQSIGIRRRDIVEELLRQKVPSAFEASGHLRFHRLLRLDEAHATVIAGVPLRLRTDLGLVVGSLDHLPPEESPA